MKSEKELRDLIKNNLKSIVAKLNSYLSGKNVGEIKDELKRLGRNNELPDWYELLESGQSMSNLDGKTIGSVIEMTLVGTLEKHIFSDLKTNPLKINPAKGVDIPSINLGIKSPSENYCTSEPFFSAYERILGNEHDALILLTDYQTAKKNPPPIRIQIIKYQYLRGSEIADKKLCSIALKNKEFLLENYDEASCKKMIQFLTHLNQSDWRGKNLLALLDKLQESDEKIEKEIKKILKSYIKSFNSNEETNIENINNSEINCFKKIKSANNKQDTIINCCNDWVIDNHKDFARMPNDNEWVRFLKSPLDGKIGMSFALQWRYNFGSIFRSKNL